MKEGDNCDKLTGVFGWPCSEGVSDDTADALCGFVTFEGSDIERDAEDLPVPAGGCT